MGQLTVGSCPLTRKTVAAVLHKVANDASVEELVFLGDLFDLWLYPIDVVPWSISRIIAANPSITQALQQCTRNLANVYYLTGNHDMPVKAHDLLPFNSGGKSIQLISPEWYRAKYQGRRHLEHGHAVDMFNNKKAVRTRDGVLTAVYLWLPGTDSNRRQSG